MIRTGQLGVFAAGLVAACLAGASLDPAHAAAIEVRSAAIPLYPDRPGDQRAGALVYRGGLQLSSEDRRFGGWSDLAVSADGSEILAVSDEARWLRARLTYNSAGDLAGLSAAEIAPMLGLDGKAMIGKVGDAEGLTLERANDLNGPVVVSFERDVRVWRYDLSKGFTARPVNVAIGNWVQTLANEFAARSADADQARYAARVRRVEARLARIFAPRSRPIRARRAPARGRSR